MSQAPVWSTPADAERELLRAADAGELCLHYQPVIDLPGQTVTGAEALLRWQHPTGGLLPPSDFLPALTHTPAMARITDWVLDTAIATAAGWPNLSVAVNIAASDAVRAGLVACVRTALARHGLSPRRLTLEVTEHALVTDLDRATRNLGRLADDGVRVSLDDFGTGYSSLLYLSRLPISEIKIDRSFVAGMTSRREDAAIVSGVIRLGQAIGATVVAEGVETEAQARRLIGLGCGRAQGYLYGEPGPRLLTNPAARVAAPRRGAHRSRGGRIATEVAAGMIRELIGQGASFHTIAAALNQRGQTTAHGTRWTSATVARAVSELE